MTDEDVEQTDERGHGPEPRRAALRTWGAAALIVLGSLAAVWVFFRLPGVRPGRPC